MWIFTKDGFYSVVQDKDDIRRLIVRARVKGDLEKLLGGLAKDVEESDDRDYRFRVHVDRGYFADKIMPLIAYNIDYFNFKDTIKDDLRHLAYTQIWAVMAILQDDKQEDEKDDRT